MLGKFLQQETLQNGLNDYLNTYKYSNADTKDLWNVFSKHTNQSLEVKVSFCEFNKCEYSLFMQRNLGNYGYLDKSNGFSSNNHH